jgi:hypothetical protein
MVRPEITLMDEELRRKAEGWKLVYADLLLRWEMLGVRTKLLGIRFVDDLGGLRGLGEAASVGWIRAKRVGDRSVNGELQRKA